jgi:anti-sigma regulatory factor (Ser/Thr protein kinase)
MTDNETPSSLGLTGYIATDRHTGMGSELSIRFKRGPTAALAARNALHALEPRLEPAVLDDIRLLVSELVTNSIRHSNGPTEAQVGLDVTISDGSIRVEVADPGPGFEPKARDDDRRRPGGWGLYLVDRIADRWGEAKNAMTRVWFEIDGVAT